MSKHQFVFAVSLLLLSMVISLTVFAQGDDDQNRLRLDWGKFESEPVPIRGTLIMGPVVPDGATEADAEPQDVILWFMQDDTDTLRTYFTLTRTVPRSEGESQAATLPLPIINYEAVLDPSLGILFFPPGMTPRADAEPQDAFMWIWIQDVGNEAIMAELDSLNVNAGETDPIVINVTQSTSRNDLLQFDPDTVPPIVPNSQAIQAGATGGTPSDIAEQLDTCATAAETYVAPGMQVIRSTTISFDDVIYDNQDEELVLYALYGLAANEYAEASNYFDSPSSMNAVAPFNESDIVTVGDQTACLNTGSFTLRLWQLESGEWVIDTLTLNGPVDLSDAWPDNIPDAQNPSLTIAPPANPVLVDGVSIRYLMPYIAPPVTTLPGATTVDNNLPGELVSCEFAAPSFLTTGMSVFVDNYGYEQYPVAFGGEIYEWNLWTLSDWQSPLTHHGTPVNNEILQTTPLVGIPGNLESALRSPAEMQEGINIGTIIDGPICTSVNAEPPYTVDGITEAPDPAHDRFYTWWQVDFGGTVGYYPENVGQYPHWTYQGILPRKLFLYYMTPINALVQPEDETCSPSQFVAGQNVQPAAGAMNLRDAPNGNIIGRVETMQVISIFGTPICAAGSNWWQTSVGGYIAENDPNGGRLLIPARSVEPTDETLLPTATPLTIDVATTQPSVEPTSAPVETTVARPTEEPTSAPVETTVARPTEEPTTPPLIATVVRPTEEPTTPPLIATVIFPTATPTHSR